MPIPKVVEQIDRVMDHRVLSLRSANGEPADRFSWYHFTFTSHGPTGNLAFWRTGDDVADHLVLTDTLDLAAALVPTIGTPAYREPYLAARPIEAAFTIGPIHDPHVCEVVADGLRLNLTWERLAQPVFAFGPAPSRPEEFDIHSVLVEAAIGRFSRDGVVSDATTFADEAWTAWMGRPMSSAILGLGEVVYLRPAADGSR